MVAAISMTGLGWSAGTIASTSITTIFDSDTGGTLGWIFHPSEAVTEVIPPWRPQRFTPARKPVSHLAGKLAAPPELRGEPVRPAAPRKPAPPSRPAWAASLRAWA